MTTISTMITLFLVICCTAIFCFFSQEFNRLFKKIFAVRGAKLILPLAIGSYVVYTFDFLILDILFYIRDKLNTIVTFLNHTLPHSPHTEDMILIILLTAVSLVPVGILHFLSYRKTHKPYPHPYLVSTLIWIICAILLISLPRLFIIPSL